MAGMSGSRPTGLDESYRAWLACFGDVVKDTAKGTRLRIRGEDQDSRREVFVPAQAGNEDQWADRSAYVERPLAKVLAAAPHAYRIAMERPRKGERGGEEVSVLRLAFGFSLSQCPRSRRRFTAYQVEPWKVAWVTEGSDRLFEHRRDTDSARPRYGWDKRFTQLLEHIEAVGEEAWRLIGSELDFTGVEQKLSVEADQLKRLYFTQGGNEARLHGLALHDLRGDAAVEAEYRQRLRNVHQRAVFELAFDPVSVGEIVCVGYRRRRKGEQAFKLPFAEAPAI
jgi:hypothetical protein